ncbi:hypothetical protein Lal_00002071 [Lupinus albus]|nr:hypothetical protein Lal_00002071 [Lupinus albus]
MRAIRRDEKTKAVRHGGKTKAVRHGGKTKAIWFSGLLLRLSSPLTVTRWFRRRAFIRELLSNISSWGNLRCHRAGRRLLYSSLKVVSEVSFASFFKDSLAPTL